MRTGCGTELGHVRHVDYGEAPCMRCYDALTVAEANRRERSRPSSRPVNPLQYRQALTGSEPAEALAQADRHRLVAHLHGWGWTDARIAEHTRMTAYTTARIRDHLALPPHCLPARSAA